MQPIKGDPVITGLSLSNFKAFKALDSFDIRPINLVFGENSSGKSSIIQSLLLLRQTQEEDELGPDQFSLKFSGDLVDLGNFTSTVHAHASDNSIKISFTTDARRLVRGVSKSGDNWTPFNEQDLTWSFDFKSADPQANLADSFGISTSHFSVRIQKTRRNKDEGYFIDNRNTMRQILQFWQENRPLANLPLTPDDLDDSTIKWIEDWLFKTPLIPLGSLYIWSPLELREGRKGRPVGGSLDSKNRRALEAFVLDWQWWMAGLLPLLRQHLTEIRYVGPLRQAPRRLTSSGAGLANYGEKIDATGEHVVSALADSESHLSRLNAALEKLELPYQANIVRVRQGDTHLGVPDLNILFLEEKGSGIALTLADVGVGISQVLPVLLELIVSKSKLILLEQPELHLHPRLQSRLADIILDSALSRQNRIIVETHSEHILYRIQRRVRERGVAASDLSVYYVEADAQGSNVKNLRLDTHGNLLDPWPPGFFDESLIDLLSDGDQHEIPLAQALEGQSAQ